MKIESLKQEDERLAGQIRDFHGFVDAIPAHRISRKYEFQKIYDPKIQAIQLQQADIQKQIAAIQLSVYTTQTKIGPITYVAKALHLEVDTVVQLLMLLFVMVFDPLAVCLIFCLNLTIRLREKYRGDEAKIGAHAMMGEVVDHRLRKVS
ncbi:MAG: hypothetical protein ACXWQO_17335, partial [Bdellovibrionota bacterium]